MISVIITTYRDAAFRLYKSIYSVLIQTLPADEIIVIDDGSEQPFDGLDNLLNNRRIKWIKNASNQGVAKSRNDGVIIATSDLICFLDAGDWWHREKLEQQSEYMIRNNLDAAFTGRIDWISNKLFSIQIPQKVRNYQQAFLIHNMGFFPSAIMIRKDVFLKLDGFNRELDIPEDRDLGYRLAKNGYRIDFLSEPLVYYEVTFQSRSANAIKKQKTYMDFIKLHSAAISREQIWDEVIALYYKNIALKFFYTYSYQNAVRWIYRSLKKKFKTKTLFQLLFFTVFDIFRPNPKWYYLMDAFVTYYINLKYLKLNKIISETKNLTIEQLDSFRQLKAARE